MLDDLLDKRTVLHLASTVRSSATRLRAVTAGPRVWLGALVLSGSLSAEKRTRTSEPTPQDRKSYLPRDMVLSFLQAHREQHSAEWTATGPAFSEGFNPDRGFDYHWVTEFLGELGTHILRRIRFRLPAGGPRTQPLAPDARIVIVGDWGTGEGVALRVAEQMRRQIAAAGDREVHVVHLGDVYYAGTAWEARHRFLDHWPVDPEQATRVRSWCLNGNHDMYSAGEGLFDVILADDRFRLQRTTDGTRTGEFHLRGADWDVVGVDTSWKFHLGDVRGGQGHLERGQRRWITERLAGSARRTVVLSHHQPFTRSAAGAAGVTDVGNLLGATAPLREGRGIDAWFWGHEHRLYSYGARSGIGYATCTGHGAVLEEPATAAVAGPGEAEFRATFRDGDGDEWRMPGFTVVDLDARTASVRYVDMNGDVWREPDRL